MMMVFGHSLARHAVYFGSGAVLGMAMLAAAPAFAQHYNVIGRPGPSVTVDTSVLDELGPPNNIGAANNANRFGPGVAVRSAPAPSGAAARVPPSRLISVPMMPGRPVPQIGRGGVVNTSAPRSEAPVAAPTQIAAPAPPPPVVTPPAPPPRQAAPAPAPVPPPAPPLASAPPPAPPVPVAPPPPQPVVNAPPAPVAPPPAPAAAMPTPVAATPTPPAPTPASAPPAPAQQVAALPPAATAPAASAAATGTSSGRLGFDNGSAALTDGARQELDQLANNLKSNQVQRLQVVAYAASQGGNTSAARRLSLSRALAVRSYLIDKGILSTRIDVRAMGAPEGANPGPADRVDLVLVSQ
jgi:outer membrane protein OmpA-like peptidoglycan-associated protein